MRLNGLLCLTALICIFGLKLPQMIGQASPPAPDNTYVAPYYLDCGHESPYQSRSARSPILSSPDQRREAYAQATARARDGCSNTSAVFVRENGRAFQLVFLQEPEEMLLGNGVRLIDWSKDGMKLLFDVLRWQYGSDVGPQDELWIYNSSSGVLKRVPLNQVFRSFHGSCGISLEPLGFSEAGDVAMRVSAKQERDVDGDTVLPTCEENRIGWLFDPATNHLMQTSYDYVPPKWGHPRSR